jgi:hypothetical protein
MGYRFQGFFSDGGEKVMQAALARWPCSTARSISTPFLGFGLCAPDPDRDAESDNDYELLLELAFSVERGLPEFSRGFPASTFVFINAECFGGVCDYSGFVVKAGAVCLQVDPGDSGSEALQHLLRALGVQLQSGYFEPFVRGYWGRK